MEKEKKKFTLQFFVTDKCNLNCRYCYEGAKKGKRTMHPEIAKSAMDRIIPRMVDYDEIIIDLIGGEPLLAFDLIKELVDFAADRRERWGRKYTFCASTNGTLLNDEMKEWLYEHRDTVVLGLSLDGTKKAHDLNRSNSYDLIEPHFPFFRETWPHQPVKMTINPQVLDQVCEGILNIYSHGLKCSANVVFEDVWGGSNREKYLQIFESELDRLVEYFGAKPELEEPSLILDLPIENFVAKMDKDWKWCGAGGSMKCIYLDGREFRCHRFASTFAERPGLDIEDSTSIADVNPRCQECKFFYACPTCDAYNYEVNGSPDYKTDYHCDLIKLQILATAKLRYKRLHYEMLKLYHVGGGLDKLAEIVNNINSILYVAKHMEIPGYSFNSSEFDARPETMPSLDLLTQKTTEQND